MGRDYTEDDEELLRLRQEAEKRKKELEMLQMEELRRIRELEQKKMRRSQADPYDSAFYDPAAYSEGANQGGRRPEGYPENQGGRRPEGYPENQGGRRPEGYPENQGGRRPTGHSGAPRQKSRDEYPEYDEPVRKRRTYDPDQMVSDEVFSESYDQDEYDEYDDYDEYDEYDEDMHDDRGRNVRSNKSRNRNSGQRVKDRNREGDRGQRDSSRNRKEDKRAKKKMEKKKGGAGRFFRNLILFILILFLIFGGAVWNITRKFKNLDTEVSQRAGSMKGSVVNILLIGQDAREGESSQRSDTMIVISVNQKKNIVSMTSIMRDTYVNIPGYGGNKINAAFAYGGYDLLDQTIEENFGITIDGNAMVDFEGFLEAMTAVGSLKMDLTAEEAQYMNDNPALGSTTDESDEVWELTEGENNLTPSQILCYSRMRYVGNSDWDRTERQRKVISGVVSEVKHGHFIKGYKVANQAAPSISTDIKTLGMLRMAFGLITSGEMNSHIVPVEGTYYPDNVNGMAVLVPDLEANKSYFQKYIEGEE